MKVFLVIMIISIAKADENGGTISGKIIGGENAADDQFPFQVSLQINKQHFCGGSIINEYFIITAGHCVYKFDPRDMTVIAGTSDLTKSGKIFEVDWFVIHREYQRFGNISINDLALIKLHTNIEFSTKIKSIEIDPNPVPVGADLTISGWGLISWQTRTLPIILQHLRTKAEDQEKCKDLYEAINDNNICILAKEGQGACSGDSGGPLIYNGKLVGVASWAIYCAKGYPDVYASVGNYYQCIQNVVKNYGWDYNQLQYC